MITGNLVGSGSHIIAPPPPNAYKRAVYRPPPAHFVVEHLSPAKQGNAYSYGMRICAVRSDGRSTKSGKSNSSNSSDSSEYEIWRRWEDCLYFQDTLEGEYSVMSREKRRRLIAGKGVKKNGVYTQENAAASFESLPPGPDPQMIAKDIHQFLPKLTKKGTVFRASLATIEQRAKEFQALVDTLLQDDVPMLMQELRSSRAIRDFFGIWRRDSDLYNKAKGKKAESSSVAGTPRTSLSSPFSMYFTASNISLQLPFPSLSDMPPSPAPLHGSSKVASGSRSVAPSLRPDTSPPPSAPVSKSFDTSGYSSDSGRARPIRNPPASAPADGSFRMSVPSLLKEDGYTISANLVHSVPALARVPPDRKRHPHLQQSHVPQSHAHTREALNVPQDAVFFERSAQRFSDPIDERESSSGLQSLPEGQEPPEQQVDEYDETYGVDQISLSDLPMPVPRTPKTPVVVAAANRNGLIFMSPPSTPLSMEYEDVDGSSDGHTVDGDSSQIAYLRPHSQDRQPQSPHAPAPSPNTINTFSSRPPSLAPTLASNVSSERSSWGTYGSGHDLATFPKRPTSSHSSYSEASCIDLDLPFIQSSASLNGELDGMNDDGMGINYDLQRPRQSMQSFMTDCSADAIIPRHLASPPPIPVRSPLGAVSRTMSIGSDELWQSHMLEGDDLIDSYMFGSESPVYRPPDQTRYDNLQGGFSNNREHISAPLSVPEQFPKPFQNRPPGQFHLPWSHNPSITEGRSSISSASSEDGMIMIKAVLNAFIVAFRAPRDMSLNEARKKLHDKFAGQDEGGLSEFFTIGHMPPSNLSRPATGRRRSSSVSSAVVSDPQKLRFIFLESEWREAIATCGEKLTLRVFDSNR